MVIPPTVGRLKAYGVELTFAHAQLAVTVNGAPATLAVLNPDGVIVCQGEAVADAAARVSVDGYRRFLAGKGWVRTGVDVSGPAALSALARITTVSHEGLRVALLEPSGDVSPQPGALAILDEAGRVIVSGQVVAVEVEAFMMNDYRDYLKSRGWLRTLSAPPQRPGGLGAAATRSVAASPSPAPSKPQPRPRSLRKTPKADR